MTNGTSIALDILTKKTTSGFAAHADLVQAITLYLLNQNEMPALVDDIIDVLEAQGYRRFFAANGRVIWKGLGLLSDREEPLELASLADHYPLRYGSTFDSPQQIP